MLLTQMDAIHRKLSDPNMPLGLRLQAADFFAKISGAYPSASVPTTAAGEKFSVNIIMGAPAQILTPSAKPVITIDAEPSVATVAHINED